MDSVEDYICPITRQIFSDPVVASDHHVYERRALTDWYNRNKTSPITRKPIKGEFYSCHLIKKQITRLLEEKPKLKADQYFDLNIEKLFDPENHWKKKEEDQLIEIFETIKEHEFDLDSIQDPKDGWKLINSACRFSLTKVVKYLIEQGVDLQNPTHAGHRPIHQVCYFSTPEILEILLEHDIDLEVKTNKGFLPIHHAIGGGKFQTIKILVDRKVNLNSATNHGAYPIHLVINHNCNLEIIKYLVEVGNVDLDVQREGKTVLHYLLLFNRPPRIFNYLLEKQSVFDHPDIYIENLKKLAVPKQRKIQMCWEIHRKFIQFGHTPFPVYQILEDFVPQSPR